MTIEEFKARAEAFAQDIEWIDSYSIQYDFRHEFAGRILVDGKGSIFEINVFIDPEDEEEIAIDCGDDHYLPADLENAYGYLWCEAISKVSELMRHSQC